MDNVERLYAYAKRLSNSTSGTTLRIGDYNLARLQYLDDVYNQAYIEENSSFVIDKNGMPHIICETQSGNANSACSSAKDIVENQNLLTNISNVLIFIDYSKKLPHSLKYGKAGQELEEKLNECFKTDNFSNLSLNGYLKDEQIEKMRSKFLKNMTQMKKSEFNFITSARDTLTREEAFGKNKEDMTL